MTVRPPFALPHPRPWLAGVQYDESDVRDHLLDGKHVSGVTTILRQGGAGQDYSRVNREVLAFGSARGTAVHLAAYYYDTYGAAANVPDYIEHAGRKLPGPGLYLKAWVKFRAAAKDHGREFNPEAREVIVASRKRQYLGRIDAIGTVDGGRKRVLIDLKCGQHPGPANLQLLMYQLALEEELGVSFKVNGIDERWAVRLQSDGNYTVFPYRDYLGDLRKLDEVIKKAVENTGITAWLGLSPTTPSPFRSTLMLFDEPDNPPTPALSGPVFEEPEYVPPTSPDVLEQRQAIAETRAALHAAFTEPDEEPAAPPLAAFCEPDDEEPAPAVVEAVLVEEPPRVITPEVLPAVAHVLQVHAPQLAQLQARIRELTTYARTTPLDTWEQVHRFEEFICQAADAKKQINALFDPLIRPPFEYLQSLYRPRKPLLDGAEGIEKEGKGRILSAKSKLKAAEAERRRAAERERLAQEAADKRRAAELAAQAQAADAAGNTSLANTLVEEARAVAQTPIPEPEPEPERERELLGERANWCADVTDTAAFRHAVMKPTFYREIADWIEQQGHADLALRVRAEVASMPELPVDVLGPDAAALKRAAASNKDTKPFPGVRFYNKPTAVMNTRARAARQAALAGATVEEAGA